MKPLQRLATDSRYTLLGLPMAAVSFAISLGGLCAGLGSAVAFVGLPILAGTAAVARNLADFERVSLPEVLGRPVARPPYPPAPAGAGWFRRMMNPLATGQGWVDVLYGIVSFPISLVAGVIALVWWGGAIAGLTFPLYGWILASLPGVDGGWPAMLGIGGGDAMFVGANTVAGVLFALTLLPVVRGAALVKANLAQAMLTRAAPHTTASINEPEWA
ncbi:Putative sensor [Nonomuraea solani]|uniref:Putative sensor n=1 Tax=Nonomuraea solani TaxID=1144553 RepID=A0A1H6E0H8_9ACTN|nr:sensor domain-containing protein [Nonomuraea solani]SEG90496.1 Putative sensor [Nonomuraea solani]